MDKSERYVVVGFGWVGQANALALKMLGYDVAYFDPGTPPHHYDKYKDVYGSIERLKDVQQKDGETTWYIVCVGDRVSEEGVQDISNIKRALDSLKDVKGGVMLRSTILPDLLEDLHFDYYIPEFLHEIKAVEECIDPYLVVIGKRKGAKQEPSILHIWRSKSRKTFEGTPYEASMIKYLSNLWNAMRIAFVNEFGDMIGRPTSSQELGKIAHVIDFLFDGRSYLRYGRAYGGHCLPKDSRAFAAWYGHIEKNPILLKAMYAANEQHRTLEEKYPLMPEWYSEWPEPHIGGRQALRELRHAIAKRFRNRSLLWNRRKQ